MREGATRDSSSRRGPQGGGGAVSSAARAGRDSLLVDNDDDRNCYNERGIVAIVFKQECGDMRTRMREGGLQQLVVKFGMWSSPRLKIFPPSWH